ncbi:MAG: hypothetical protein WCE62_01630, partial [Polyangiales bacterium]
GSGGSQPACATNALCSACPSSGFCDGDGDCPVGHLCIESGCDTNDGASIKQCAFVPAGACDTTADCTEGRECVLVPDEGMRCVKTTPGCNSSFDCVLGFSCEDGVCIDRRVPCYFDESCPKSHYCHRFDATGFCMRMHQSCEEEFDCSGIAPRCEDIDDDGTTECAGALDPNVPSPVACLNAMCSGNTPVCEVGEFSAFSACGQYGLCKDAGDCVAGFECLGLWLDGRKECVPTGGDCSNIRDCPTRQVCASPRSGGAPSCQAGLP